MPVVGCVRWIKMENGHAEGDNGMDTLVFLISSMLFMMERNEIAEEIAYDAKWDIMDFETGACDDLLTPEDLILIRADIRKINDYFALHPELIQGIEEEKARME